MGPYFIFLGKYDDAQVAAVLGCEQPRTISVVLGRIAPETAAKVMRLLPAALATEVSRAMASSDKVDDAVVGTIERTLRKKFMHVATESVMPGK
jgi:flagellar motor switch protein FliG